MSFGCGVIAKGYRDKLFYSATAILVWGRHISGVWESTHGQVNITDV